LFDIYFVIELIVLLVIVLIMLSGAYTIIRPTHRALVERLGKYNRFCVSGLNWKIPLIEKVVKVDITEQLVTADPQQIITKDKLNATVDAQIYFKVNDDEKSVKACKYNVFNYQYQIVQLARTTLRNIIGTLSLTEANSQRDKINTELMITLAKETENWGIKVVRTELKEIDPPKDVQETMNMVVKAENTKTANIDFATAQETKADGDRRSQIKIAEGMKQASILEAEGERQSKILRAQGEAEAIRIVNESANKYFVDNAQVLRKLQAVEVAFGQGTTKVVVPEGISLVNVLTDAADISRIVPVETKTKTKTTQ
jgi:regulator of protease activity HflC (stomatin/prohibitin superfamily)